MPHCADSFTADFRPLRISYAGLEEPVTRLRQRLEGDHVFPYCFRRSVDDDYRVHFAKFELWLMRRFRGHQSREQQEKCEQDHWRLGNNPRPALNAESNQSPKQSDKV